MDILSFIEQYKGMLGGLSIAIATLLAVVMNLRHIQHTNYKNKRNKDASLSTALASELMDNAHNLMALYLEIEQRKSRRKIIGYKQFSTHAYESLLEQIGELGSTLSFMVVDVYGDIKKMKSQLDELTDSQIMSMDEELLEDIQTILIKTITSSITLHLYADYKTGINWIITTRKHRLLWIESNLDEFFQYLGKTEQEFDFIDDEENQDLIFMRRFPDSNQRQLIRELFKTIKYILLTIGKEKPWRTQLILRAFAFKLSNMLAIFLGKEIDKYELRFEQEYQEYLDTVKEQATTQPSRLKFWKR